MQHKFQILDVAEFDILEDAHECVIMSINDIPEKTPIQANHPFHLPIPITNVTFDEEEERQLDDDKVNN